MTTQQLQKTTLMNGGLDDTPNGGGDGLGGNGGKNGKGKNNDVYDLTVVPGTPNPKDPGQINVADYSANLINNPSLGFVTDNPKTPENESMFLSDHNTAMDPSAGLIDPTAQQYQMDPNALAIQGQTAANVANGTAQTVDAAKTFSDVAAQDMTGAKGTLSDGSLISDIPQVDMQGIGTGTNADGSINYVGQALKKYAAQDFTNIIDTSTVAGKLLAQSLGEGGYTDSKATLKGQLDILQSEFVDSATGLPKIPSWAAGTARNVSKIAAFKGMSGTAATAAMSQALLEASIPIAQSDAQFFQTLTLQNLDNRQQSIINTANTLAKFEQTNVDNRMAAAIQNAKSFLEMDMANLSNEQQARVINYQGRVQSILEDAKSENTARMFNAKSQNDMDMFYDNLNSNINMFNAGQMQDASKFNSTMADSREKFYKEMQYNIDISNAKWRQEVELTEDAQDFTAASTDVKNMYDLSTAQLNQLWDRSDAMLDYAWKSFESEQQRINALAQISLAGDIKMDAQMMEGLGMLAGTFISSSVGQNFLGSIFKGVGGLFS